MKRSKTTDSELFASAGHVQLAEGDFIMREFLHLLAVITALNWHAGPQTKRCFHYDYNQDIVSRCLACRKKKVGDTCRFVGIRLFKLKPGSLDAVGVSFDSPKEKDEPDYQLPLRWNIIPTIEQVKRMQVRLAMDLVRCGV